LTARYLWYYWILLNTIDTWNWWPFKSRPNW
jgi:hypothetical protein